jgi:hypothetical protein
LPYGLEGFATYRHLMKEDESTLKDEIANFAIEFDP